MLHASRDHAKRGGRIAAAGLLLLATAGCALTGPKTEPETMAETGIGFRQQRLAQMANAQSFDTCRGEGEELDRHARQSGEPAQYLASARILEGCEATLGTDAELVDTQARMQVYALAIQNYAKGGDLAKARETLGHFEQTFEGRDLYYPDGTSFRETMAMVLGLKAETDAGRFSTANVNKTLKGELRRVQYWLDH